MQEAAQLPLAVAEEKTEKGIVDFKHTPALDGVRGIAILIVMVYHLEWLFPGLHEYVKGGFLGVDVFFVLSGFLITSILLSEQDKTGGISLKKFYLRRCLRLIPAFWLFLIGLYIFGTYLLPEFQAGLVYGRNDFLFAVTYTMNWFSASNHSFDSNLNHVWSLSIEEQFYILWSLILWKAFADNTKRRFILYLTLGFVAALCVSRAVRALTGADLRTLYYSTDTRIDSILIGCAASMIYMWKMVSPEFLSRMWFPIVSLLALASSLVVLVLSSHEGRNLYISGLPIFNISIAILIFWLVNRKGTAIHKILESRVLVWIGNISYSLYLWHYLMYEFAKKEFATPGSEIFVGVTLAFAIACASYYFVEKPFLKLKHRFEFRTVKA
jgi:peptidoglycan/LPS O-acetylase OafA/YrhL